MFKYHHHTSSYRPPKKNHTLIPYQLNSSNHLHHHSPSCYLGQTLLFRTGPQNLCRVWGRVVLRGFWLGGRKGWWGVCANFVPRQAGRRVSETSRLQSSLLLLPLFLLLLLPLLLLLQTAIQLPNRGGDLPGLRSCLSLNKLSSNCCCEMIELKFAKILKFWRVVRDRQIKLPKKKDKKLRGRCSWGN